MARSTRDKSTSLHFLGFQNLFRHIYWAKYIIIYSSITHHGIFLSPGVQQNILHTTLVPMLCPTPGQIIGVCHPLAPIIQQYPLKCTIRSKTVPSKGLNARTLWAHFA